MAFNPPSSPSVNQLYSDGAGKNWQWDGTRWYPYFPPLGISEATTGSFNAGSASTVPTQGLILGGVTPKTVLLDAWQQVSNKAFSKIRTATFASQVVITPTSGSITVDWRNAQNQKQTEPTGTITYTFTAPSGPCHLQLLVDSDGTSTAQTIVWPGTVVWLGTTWSGINNKKAAINFWYDGTSYFAIGTNQV